MRVYKTPYATDTAFQMILDGECGVFSPKIIDCFQMAKSVLFETSEKFSFADFNEIENSLELPKR